MPTSAAVFCHLPPFSFPMPFSAFLLLSTDTNPAESWRKPRDSPLLTAGTDAQISLNASLCLNNKNVGCVFGISPFPLNLCQLLLSRTTLYLYHQICLAALRKIFCVKKFCLNHLKISPFFPLNTYLLMFMNKLQLWRIYWHQWAPSAYVVILFRSWYSIWNICSAVLQLARK